MNIKKLFLPLMMVALLFCGCARETGAIVSTTYFTITPGEWNTNSNVGYAYVEKPFHELDEYVIQQGAVMAFYIDGDGYDNQLPYLAPYYSDSDNDGIDELYFENIRYDLARGCITFIIQQSDLACLVPTQNLRFKVCIIANR